MLGWVFSSKCVELFLCRNLGIFVVVIFLFNEHILYDSDREKIEVADGNAQFNTAQQKERSC
jgi:hypothetical protein